MYLVAKLKAKIKHIWRGKDTFCRQYSTGGLNKDNYLLVENSELPVCVMCDRKHAAYRGVKSEPRNA